MTHLPALRLVCVALLPMGALPAAAQDADPACTYGTPEAWAEVAASYDGFWVMQHLSGFAVTGPMTIPFGAAGDDEVLGITARSDGTLVAEHPEAQEPLVMQWADEPVWAFESEAEADGIPEPMLDSADLELMMGCPNDRMARLVGTSSATIEGVTMDFTYRLMIVSSATMYGIMHVTGMVQGYEFNAWRSVSLTR